MPETPLAKAEKLFQKYNQPGTTNAQQERIVVQLYNLGYVIRPLKTYIIKNEVEAEVLNAGSKEWGLVDRRTGLPAQR